MKNGKKYDFYVKYPKSRSAQKRSPLGGIEISSNVQERPKVKIFCIKISKLRPKVPKFCTQNGLRPYLLYAHFPVRIYTWKFSINVWAQILWAKNLGTKIFKPKGFVPKYFSKWNAFCTQIFHSKDFCPDVHRNFEMTVGRFWAHWALLIVDSKDEISRKSKKWKYKHNLRH